MKKNNFDRTNNTCETKGLISREDKNSLYKLLTAKFPCGRPFPLRLVSSYLANNGVDKSKYGFSKMKELLEALDYIKISASQDKATATVLPRKAEAASALARLVRKPERSGSAQIGSAPRREIPSAELGRELESFAFLESWQRFLSDLADKARREDWDFADAPDKRRSILRQYIKYTFSRLVRENKVCVSADGQLAAFNTGLVDEYLSDVYACFVPNKNDRGTAWRYEGFCTAGSRGVGKRLVDAFDPLPQPPSYFKNSEDVIFDHTGWIQSDFEHIILDNIDRLPLSSLRGIFYDNGQARGLADSILVCGDYRCKRDLYAQLREIVGSDSRLFMRIQSRFGEAIERARKLVRLDYKTAVPIYYPREDSMSLMLPLDFTGDGRPDAALVVNRTGSGCYQGQTILTLCQAYIDARQVSSTVDGWLSLSGITADPNTIPGLSPTETAFRRVAAEEALSA